MADPLPEDKERTDEGPLNCWYCDDHAAYEHLSYGVALECASCGLRGPVVEGMDAALKHWNALMSGMAAREAAEARATKNREALIVAMGGPGWETEYECGHGVTMLKPCHPRCRHNPLRAALSPETQVAEQERAK